MNKLQTTPLLKIESTAVQILIRLNNEYNTSFKPIQIDAFLMMWHTKCLKTYANRCDVDAQFEQINLRHKAMTQ